MVPEACHKGDRSGRGTGWGNLRGPLAATPWCLVQFNVPEWLKSVSEGSLGCCRASSRGGLVRGLVRRFVEPSSDRDPLGGAWVTGGAVEHVIEHSVRCRL
eukprot:8477220-Lingulodinium_polyedra.AAC.1